ncbi:MAG: hypothetical protein AAB360_02500 [Patescibacteria group bacterium]
MSATADELREAYPQLRFYSGGQPTINWLPDELFGRYMLHLGSSEYLWEQLGERIPPLLANAAPEITWVEVRFNSRGIWVDTNGDRTFAHLEKIGCGTHNVDTSGTTLILWQVLHAIAEIGYQLIDHWERNPESVPVEIQEREMRWEREIHTLPLACYTITDMDNFFRPIALVVARTLEEAHLLMKDIPEAGIDSGIWQSALYRLEKE